MKPFVAFELKVTCQKPTYFSNGVGFKIASIGAGKVQQMKVELNKEYHFKGGQYLWKYLDLHRLIYFLHTENLFFSPLNSFYDPLEGITQKDLYQMLEWDKNIQTQHGNVGGDRKTEQHGRYKKEVAGEFRKKLDLIQRTFFASCWYCGTRESLAMWNTYSNKDSVALRFDPKQLCDKIISTSKQFQHEDFTVMVHGMVDYFQISPFDPTDHRLNNCGHRFKGFLKDLSYKHEEEFRFLVFQSHPEETYEYFEFPLANLNEIEFSIVTHPFMEEWKYNNIMHALKNKGLEDRLIRSAIPTRRGLFEVF